MPAEEGATGVCAQRFDMRIPPLQASGHGLPCRIRAPYEGFLALGAAEQVVPRRAPSPLEQPVWAPTGREPLRSPGKRASQGPAGPSASSPPSSRLLQNTMASDWSSRNDGDVVRGFLAGDPAARQELGRRLAVVAPKVRAHNQSLPSPLEDSTVKDITQKIQLDLIKRLPQYNGSRPLSVWAGGFVTRHFYKHFASHRREQQVQRNLSQDYTADLSDVASEDLTTEVRHLLQALPTEERQLLQLRIYREWTFARIAEVTGRSESAVKSAFRRLLLRLRDRLGPM